MCKELVRVPLAELVRRVALVLVVLGPKPKLGRCVQLGVRDRHAGPPRCGPARPLGASPG
ncbi:hypothetical protein [Streptomyces halstedii]|uniref:Uncharacterized protein n=1 Tax=Streptomyces halstedii TaxID=1944 RepID=A0A6N9UAQ4_STRHA|nr:hypothetical protein [Streptomyces halstedii]NEA19106.1 hypothetical protein [Streptomyces halstedii]